MYNYMVERYMVTGDVESNPAVGVHVTAAVEFHPAVEVHVTAAIDCNPVVAIYVTDVVECNPACHCFCECNPVLRYMLLLL
jgi:hypothetical protein